MTNTTGMPRVSTKGPSGLAKVKLGKTSTGKNAVQVIFLDEDGNDGDKYQIIKSGDNVPEYVQAGKFMVSLSSDRKKINNMRPVSGQFKGKVKTFPAREGEKPAPRSKQGQYGPYEVFSVIIEITEPDKYAGMEVYLELPFKFVPYQMEVGGEMKEVVGIPQSKSASVAMLDDFVLASQACKVGPIPYSDNPLPTLQKRILRQAATIDFVMKNGWISAINPPDINEGEEDADWATEEKEPKAAPAKPAAPAKGKSTTKLVVEDDEDEKVTDWGEPDEEEDSDGKKKETPWEDEVE